MKHEQSVTSLVKEIKRRTRRLFSSEEKIKIVLEGLRGEESIKEICRKYVIHENQYYKWSKEFIEAGKKRLNGDTEKARANTRSLYLTGVSTVSSRARRRSMRLSAT